MTGRHLIAFLVGAVLAWMARNGEVKSVLPPATKPNLFFRSASYAEPCGIVLSVSRTEPRAMILNGDFPVCSAVVAGDALYTARHCLDRAKEGDEVEVLLQNKGTPVRQRVYLQKVYSDIAILSFSKTAKVNTPKAVKVNKGARVVAVMGIMFSSDLDVYYTSLPYLEREGKVLAVFTAKEIGMSDLASFIPPTAKFVLLDIGSFGGSSGSGVYLIDRWGKRHLIGVVSAGFSDYTVVALF
jgi:hypothetical protein